eukprot:TRINITY_DN45079_c0_g1_i1.p2 TRINITY_DN45079_c0_g1~~TRINITY_DN45079_c0_g1_i1.p2  ORF type:complete len:137 (-),score=51.20 TRINITY_DN45079_c0_g1_i1:252-662(-)
MGWGGGYGKGGGGMDMMSMMWDMMSWGGGGWGKGKGKGKGKYSDNQAKRTPPPRKVFVGGLPVLGKNNMDFALNKKLKEHCNQAGVCTYAEIGFSGTGTACFKTDEEATAAVDILNGTEFEGNVLQVSAWVKKNKQ